MKVIDLWSDTRCPICSEMRVAMAQAEVGEDYIHEDQITNRLEEMTAQKLGMETGLFCASGTMATLIALLTYAGRGDEIIVGDRSHLFLLETGNAAGIGGIHTRTVPNDSYGRLSPIDVETAIRPSDSPDYPAHRYPTTKLVCLENTHGASGGTVLGLEDMQGIAEVCRRQKLPLYCDGARFFNAATYLGVSADNLAGGLSTISISFNKGLGAPVGAVLCGPADFIAGARKIRQMIGGGMHKPGVMAAACIVGLEKMIYRLPEDHANARFLAEGLASMDGVAINLKAVQTNILFLNIERDKDDKVRAALDESGIRYIHNWEPGRFRLVTHYGVTREDMVTVLDVFHRALEG